MEEFYKILDNYLTAYESALGKNFKKANMLRGDVEKLQLTMMRFNFSGVQGDYKRSAGLFLKMLNILRVDKLSPLRSFNEVEIEKYFKG